MEYDSPNPDSIPTGVTERVMTTKRSSETIMTTPEVANSNRSGLTKNVITLLHNIITNVNIQRHNEFINLSKSMEYFYDKLTGYLNEIVKKEEQVFTLLHFLLDDLLNLYNYLDLDDEQRY